MPNVPSSCFHRPPLSELRWAARIAAIIMLLTCLPYLFGLAITPAGDYYSGFLTNPDEHNVYLSLMRQAQNGAFFFSDMFTAEPQQGRVINLLWLALGLSARATHLPLPIVYHLARVIAGWLLLMAIYCLVAQVLVSVGARRVALVLTATASGFGWLWPSGPGQPNPIDFGPGLVMPEAITFLTLLLNPLFAFSVFLLLVLYLAAVHAFASGSVRAALLAGAAALALSNIHSYDVIPATVVLGVFLIYLLATRRAGGRAVLLALLIAALAAPALLYQLWLQRTGEISLLVKAVNQPPSPELRYVALGFGIPLALAAVGVLRAVRGNDWARLLALWLVLGGALVYAPIPFQRKLIEGLHVPVCLLAIFALAPLWERRPRQAALMATLLIVLALPSNVFFARRAMRDLTENNRRYLVNLMPPLYLTADQRAALRALDEPGGRREVLLGNSLLSNYAPSLSAGRVYFGHWSETPGFAHKIGEYSWFLRASTSDVPRESFARARGITYVLRDQGLDARYLPAGEEAFDASRSPWLERVFAQGTVVAYRVKER